MHITQSILHIFHNSFFILIGFVGIGFLIGFHELGHFLFCKLFNIRTPSFSIGMGPSIFKKKIGHTEFALSAIPIGGYVEIAGSHEMGQGEQKEAFYTGKYSFAAKPYWQKMLVMAGGILFNFLFAYFSFSLLFYLGMPKSPLTYPFYASTTISSVAPESPANKAGLQLQDNIVAIDGSPITSASDIITTIKDKANKTVTLTYMRNNQKKIKAVKLGSIGENNSVGSLGVEFDIPSYSIFTSIKHGIYATNYMIYQIVYAFKNMFTQRKFNNMGGPIMIISETVKGAQKGFKIFLLFLAFISVNLAILNIIPLPIMDGGQALYYTIEAITRKPLPETVRWYINFATWIGLLLLLAYLSIKDVIKIFLS